MSCVTSHESWLALLRLGDGIQRFQGFEGTLGIEDGGGNMGDSDERELLFRVKGMVIRGGIL